MATSPFETLGVDPGASRKEITEAYKALVQIYHPDRFAGMPERVVSEAERKMKELTEAYALIRSGQAAAAIAAEQATVAYEPRERRTQWPRASAPAEEPVVDAEGVVAEPLPAPAVKYSVGQWNLATTRWSWSDVHHAWVCSHGRDMCGSCGATPDAISVKAGVPRPPMQWRRATKDMRWVCVSHHRAECGPCGRPPADEPRVVDIRSGSRRGRNRGGRVAWG